MGLRVGRVIRKGRGGACVKHPFAITLDVGTSKINHTGSWRTSRPVYVDRLPPCNAPVRRARTFRDG